MTESTESQYNGFRNTFHTKNALRKYARIHTYEDMKGVCSVEHAADIEYIIVAKDSRTQWLLNHAQSCNNNNRLECVLTNSQTAFTLNCSEFDSERVTREGSSEFR